MIVVNVIVSAITTLFVVRALMNPGDPPSASMAVAAPVEATQPVTPTTPVEAPAASTTPGEPATTPAGATDSTATPASPAIAPVVTTPTSRAQVRISAVLFPGQLSREVVVLVNEGDTVDLTGWVLASSSGIAYTFGNVTLLKDSFINLHTTTGADVPTDLFWNRAEAAWKAGDRLTLLNDDQEIATFTVVER
ncbi:MAG: lamin tail domain-containing protein [Candidatus Roseilinea sp.]